MDQILAQISASISELKRNPNRLLEEAGESAIVILNHNEPTAYFVPAETYEALLDRLEDYELALMVEQRKCETDQAVEVSLDEL